MKLSLYNSVIPIEDKHTLIYNALTSNFLVIKNYSFDQLSTDTLASLENEDSSLFTNLRSGGMLVDDDVDEIAIVEERIREAIRKDFTVLTNYLRKDVRDSCYGDKVNQVLINYDGKLFGCTARDFVEENSIGELGEYGELIYNQEKLQRRSNSKFKKEVCKRCRIAPICGGGCKQKAFEMENIDSCPFNYSSEDKDKIVLDIFEYYISNSSNHLNNN